MPVLGLRGRQPRVTAGAKRQAQMGKKSATGLHRLSVGPCGYLGKGYSKRTFPSTLCQKWGMAEPEGTC